MGQTWSWRGANTSGALADADADGDRPNSIVAAPPHQTRQKRPAERR